MLKPYSFLLYFLSAIFSFFSGITVAGMVDAGKGQMLAGGAIVLGYGVVGALLGFLIALLLAYRVNRKTILLLNALLAFGILSFWGYYYMKYQDRQQKQEQLTPGPVTAPAERENNSLLLP